MATIQSRGRSNVLIPGLHQVPAGGGAFELPDLTIGVFHRRQDGHEIAVGSDRRLHRPLDVDEGWILPAGSNGLCTYDEALSYSTVAVPAALMKEAGLGSGPDFAPLVGCLDPLLVQLVKTAVQQGDEAPLLYRETMALALATHLAHTLAPSIAPAAFTTDPRLRRALDYIYDHLADDLSLDDMATEAAMSPFHFSRVFKAATGQSPLQYVISERLKLAQMLFRTTSLSVAEIANRAGYEDVSRFGQHFKRATGVTPAAFRRV